MQEKIPRTRLHFYGSHATLNLMNAFRLSYCLRLPCLSQYTVLYMQKLYIWNCNRVPEPTWPLCNSSLNTFSNGHSFCFIPKVQSWSHVLSYCIKTVQAVSTMNLFCFVFDLLFYTVKLFLSGIKGILFSVLDITTSVIYVLSSTVMLLS